MQVLDYDEQGLIVRAHEQDRDQRVNGQLPLAIRRQVERRIAIPERHPQQPGQQRPHRRPVQTVRRQQAVQLVQALPGGVVQPELQDPLQHLDDRVESRVHEVGRTVQVDDERVRELGHMLLERPDQPRLADARLARHQGHATPAGPGPRPPAGQCGQFAVATLHGEKPAPRGHLQPGPRPALVQHLVDRHRRRDAPDGVHAEIAAVEVARDQPVRRRADHHRVGRGQGLQPRGDVRRNADRSVLHTLAGRKGAGHDQAGVDANPDVQVDAVLRLKAAVELLDGLDDPESGTHGPLGVVLMRRRESEVDHDAVAQIVVGVALKAADHGRADAMIGSQSLA